eukprot:TRINITY_DN11812_c0_g1_i1.p1 TRINITY_DN11812_c0_g1~~TRINITY_DN11812_c0_g1_i1.p1  ORF type:complete len:253 (+),score=43.17 TRINITY_DN11812_c0_g1_i1:163-921(+)
MASRLTKEWKDSQANLEKRRRPQSSPASLVYPTSYGSLVSSSSSSSSSLTTLLRKKFEQYDDECEIILFPSSEHSSLFHWTAFILGPPDSPYANARFQLRIQVPSSYPLTPPKVHFVTKICHPNIHFKTGEVCLDVLKDAWTPIWTLETVCRAVILLLTSPEPKSPLNCDAANLLRFGDVKGFNCLAKMYTTDHAILTPAFFKSPSVAISSSSSLPSVKPQHSNSVKPPTSATSTSLPSSSASSSLSSSSVT